MSILSSNRAGAAALRAVAMIAMTGLPALLAGCASAPAGDAASESAGERFVGGLVETPDLLSVEPRPVRNDVAQPAEEIVTIRYWRIEKGSFDEFLDASVNGVWPYFEKLGSRVIGMWQVVHPEGIPAGELEESPDYDEVFLATRYASVDHWRATREMATLGGNGPDWAKCRRALATRGALTISTHVRFLRGSMAPGGPYYMPGLGESYRRVE